MLIARNNNLIYYSNMHYNHQSKCPKITSITITTFLLSLHPSCCFLLYNFLIKIVREYICIFLVCIIHVLYAFSRLFLEIPENKKKKSNWNNLNFLPLSSSYICYQKTNKKTKYFSCLIVEPIFCFCSYTLNVFFMNIQFQFKKKLYFSCMFRFFFSTKWKENI